MRLDFVSRGGPAEGDHLSCSANKVENIGQIADNIAIRDTFITFTRLAFSGTNTRFNGLIFLSLQYTFFIFNRACVISLRYVISSVSTPKFGKSVQIAKIVLEISQIIFANVHENFASRVIR